MSYLRMTPPEENQPTQRTILIDVDIITYSPTYEEYIIDGKELSEYDDIKELKEAIKTLINENK